MENTFRFNLGTFTTASATGRRLTAQGAIEWNELKQGCERFVPTGDNAGVSLAFKSRRSVTGADIQALDQILEDLGGDSPENFAKIHFGSRITRRPIAQLAAEVITRLRLDVFIGDDSELVWDTAQSTLGDIFEHREFLNEQTKYEANSLCAGFFSKKLRYLMREFSINGSTVVVLYIGNHNMR